MSWPLAAFALLAVALAAGFWSYERRRPDARVVALAGTLAAFAALGRIAFAALPNVKPTTDIVLISGYALGGGPGFAVGAVAALTSNLFFGQGPWTPWQMAGWGAIGLLGAGLAAVWGGPGRRPPARWPLALVCCAAGFAFTVVQDLGDWVTYSDHSLAQLAVYVGKGLGFDAIHAAGCLAFALAFGPALARSVARFARRLEVTWLPAGGVAPVLAVALAAGAVAGAAELGARAARPASAAAAQTPVAYLLGAENRDGGFGAAPGQPSAGLFTGWAALGLASAGRDLRSVDAGRLLRYLRAHAPAASDTGGLERTILVVRAAGLSPRDFGGRDLVAELRARIARGGSVSRQVNLTAFAVMALRAAGARVPARTLGWLERQQDGDGGFSFAGAGGSSDVDDTGAALEALSGLGGRAIGVRARAVASLRRSQDRDGGFPQQGGGGSNAQSTAWAVQGLIAAGVHPAAVRRPGGVSPLVYERSLVAPDGHVRYARGLSQTPVWVTGEVLMALEGKPLPLTAPPAALRPLTAHRRRPAHSRRAAARARPRHARKPRAGVGRPRRRRRGSPRPAAAGAGMAAAAQAEVARLSGTIGAATALALAPLGL